MIKRQSGDDSIKWIVPAVDCLSYQVDEKPFEIYEEDFIKTMMDYILFEKGVDSDEFGKSLLPRILYSNQVNIDDKTDC